MNSIRTDPVCLDTNEYIFAIRRLDSASTALVTEILPNLRLFIPLQVYVVLQHNLSNAEMSEFFALISLVRQVEWSFEPASGETLQHYLGRGAKNGDARIAAQLSAAGIRWLISDNRHFLHELAELPFSVISAKQAVEALGDPRRS